jgi:hypothetical protein
VLLPELAELGAHLVEGAVPVVGAELQLLPSADETHECHTEKTNTKTTRSKKKKRQSGRTTQTHLEDMPRGAAVDPQRLVQRSVERSAVAAQLLPQLLLLLSIDEEGGWRVDALLLLPRVRCWTARARGRSGTKRP